MDDPSNTPLLATAERDDDEPIEWVLHDVTPRQAVMVRAFLRWSYGRRAVKVTFVGRDTFADFVAHYDDDYAEFLADGWRGPYSEE